ncbi:MAG: DUF3098 domain-containing protein [Fidelibacterota bacterium]
MLTSLNFAAAVSKKKDANKVQFFSGWAFGKINYIFFGIGLALILSGYAVMAAGSVNSFQSLTLAPFMLFLGYVVAIPFALIYRHKKRE